MTQVPVSPHFVAPRKQSAAGAQTRIGLPKGGTRIGLPKDGKVFRVAALPVQGEREVEVKEKDKGCECGKGSACDCKGGGTFIDEGGKWIRKKPTDMDLAKKAQRSLPLVSVTDSVFKLYVSGHIPSTILTPHHPQWVSDASSTSCNICRKPFTFFSRRHHCRGCGTITCSSCSTKRVTLHDETWRNVRLCDPCNTAILAWRYQPPSSKKPKPKKR